MQSQQEKNLIIDVNKNKYSCDENTPFEKARDNKMNAFSLT